MKNKIKKHLTTFWPFWFVATVIIVACVGSCVDRNTVSENERIINERVASHIRVIEYDEHEYLVYENGRVCGITHSGSCKKCR